jgi:signal transduction histidine kinase
MALHRESATADKDWRTRADGGRAQSPPATLVTTWSTKIVEADGKMGDILGVDVGQLIGKPLAVFVDLPDRNDFRTRLGAIPDGGYDGWHLRLRHADRSCRSVIANVKCVASSGADGRPHLRWALRIDGAAPASTVRDTLEEAVGHLSHDLNQPLAAIVSYARGCLLRAQSKTLKDEDLKMILEQIVAEALRAGAIVREFRRKDSGT